MTKNELHSYFTVNLLLWNLVKNKRPMPWKGEKDPYKIWLSEIILQQTRVEQGLNYYIRFIKTFPTVFDLANAPETAVFKLWEGLGYYTRCKNLIASAKYIANELNGKFPDRYDEILRLKGIGPYTAAAIASFAYNLQYAVVDGNVFRVLARYFALYHPIDSTEGKKYFTQLANILLDKKQPGIYNQALMDFGATICKPKLPLCIDCALQKHCGAYHKNLVNALPVKEKKITKKIRWFYYLLIEFEGRQYVRKRGAKDIWENLYEFVLIESANSLATDNLKEMMLVQEIFINLIFEIVSISGVYKQQLTHQTIYGQFIKIQIFKPLNSTLYEPVSANEISLLPFPKFITTFLKDKNVSLNLF